MIESKSKSAATVLVVERDVLMRSSVAQYLRQCGYRVIEAANTDEALVVIQENTVPLDVLLVDARAPGSLNGFELVQRAKTIRASIESLVVGTPKRVAVAAGNLCEEGPTASKPYDHAQLHDEILRLLACRERET